MSDAQRAELHEATASTDMATLLLYRDVLEQSGFVVAEQADISANFVVQYQEIIEKLETLEAEITDSFSAKVYTIMLEKNSAILQGFEDGLIGGGRFVATIGQGA